MERPGTRTISLVSYLVCFGVSWVGVAFWIRREGNADLFLYLNQLGGTQTDRVFGVLTAVGDGLFFFLAAVALFFWHRRTGLALLAGFLFSALAAQVLKKVFFGTWVRPRTYFADRHLSFHIPEGVRLYQYNSFPSGHTVSAFCLAVLVAYCFPRGHWQLLALVVAWGVGLSRIMQGQHFPLDVLAGSLIGTACGLAVRYLFFPTFGRPSIVKGRFLRED